MFFKASFLRPFFHPSTQHWGIKLKAYGGLTTKISIKLYFSFIDNFKTWPSPFKDDFIKMVRFCDLYKLIDNFDNLELVFMYLQGNKAEDSFFLNLIRKKSEQFFKAFISKELPGFWEQCS